MVKRKLITESTIGDIRIHPVLKPLVEALNKTEYKYTTRCISLLDRYRFALNGTFCHDYNLIIYNYTLIKNDIIKSLKISRYEHGLPEDVYTHMCNLVIGMYRVRCRLINRNYGI